MSINTALDWTIEIVGDGTSSSIDIPLSTAPLGFSNPGVELSTLFSLLTSKPVAVSAVTLAGPSPPSVTAATLDSTATVLTVAFGSALLAATDYTLSGQFSF